MKMETPKKPTFLFTLLNLLFILPSSSQPTLKNSTPTSYCGKIKIQYPFSLHNSINSSPLNQMLLCKSPNLYFRTTLGLFPVSSIDYKEKTLTISHLSCSSSHHFISPTLLSAGFPSLPQPNSLLLFNCSNREKPISYLPQNCTHFYGCRPLTDSNKQVDKGPFSCLFVDDYEKLETGFDPKELNCSHYRRIYRSSSSSFNEGFEFGTRVSFGIPDHIPNICDECSKPSGNCGIGLRCICHPSECKDKVFSKGVSANPCNNLLFSLLLFTFLLVSLMA
ncbi:uncharacterized protein LOC143881820 [Tasmannia lanceolata]|uniref:uncharacterized protein LOC143881820 n=1 Tax=Tasmannia lanceolata TaxID=3420 RepID=UPI004063ED9E